MEAAKINVYCQFCLREQTKDHPKVKIGPVLKQNYFKITQKKINTTMFSGFICCDPCLQEFERVIAYRDVLLSNQKTLDNLYEQRFCCKSELSPFIEELIVEESSDARDLIKLIEGDKEFIDADAINECSNCGEHLNHSSFDHHVCPRIKVEELEEENDLESPYEQEGFEESLNKKKKYPKKKLSQPIDCPKCSRQFFYKAYFQFHYKDVHRDDREEICQFCGKVFKNSRRLNSHILIHQSDSDKKYKCDMCTKQFNFSGDLTRHKRVHENIKPYKCHLCPKSFVQSYALKLHINVHNKIKYTCDLCATEFSGKPTLKKHMVKCLNGIAVSRSLRSSNGLERERYKCFSAGCDRQFSSRKYLGVHLEKSHNLKFDSFETTCLECQLVFDTAGDYSVHVKTHSCVYVCDLCKLRFKTEEKLQTHVSKLHKEGEDRPFVCTEADCGARFKRAEHLRGHQLYKHSDERKFECNRCELKFRQRGEFNVHMRVHMNSKPFSCWQCNHVCKTSSNLRQHMSLVHNESCIYFCKDCHQTFRYNTDLTQHKKEHSSTSSTVYEVVEMS